MNELITQTNSETEINQISPSNARNKNPHPKFNEVESTPIPRPQNKMVAETTSDMFMSGMMCE